MKKYKFYFTLLKNKNKLFYNNDVIRSLKVIFRNFSVIRFYQDEACDFICETDGVPDKISANVLLFDFVEV